MEIVAIHGGPVRDEGHPDPKIIAMIEEALERAKRGEITSLAIAEIHVNGATQQEWHALHPVSLLGEIARLQARVATEID